MRIEVVDELRHRFVVDVDATQLFAMFVLQCSKRAPFVDHQFVCGGPAGKAGDRKSCNTPDEQKPTQRSDHGLPPVVVGLRRAARERCSHLPPSFMLEFRYNESTCLLLS